MVLIKDSDFLKPELRRKSKHGIIYVNEPVRKNNVEKLEYIKGRNVYWQ